MQHAKWALITGASGGLGTEFARSLAQRKLNLILTARRREQMEKLSEELQAVYGVQVLVQEADLSKEESVSALQETLASKQIVPDVLINNAGFGLSGAFMDQDPQQIQHMLQVDIASLVNLTYVFGKPMVERGSGHILLVASLAAFQPTPLLAAYSAAKSFILNFGEALHVELGPKVGVTVVSPGMMETGFFQVAGFKPKASLKASMVSPARVAESGVKALFSGKSGIVVGRINRLSAFGTRFMSRRFQAKLAYRVMKG